MANDVYVVFPKRSAMGVHICVAFSPVESEADHERFNHIVVLRVRKYVDGVKIIPRGC